jgi:5-methylcytosine-specific restriction endonuclease McrA
MVAKLTLPEVDSTDIVRAVVAQRTVQKDFFNSLEDDWLSRVTQYVQYGGNPSNIVPLDLSPYISQDRIDTESTRVKKDNENDIPLERLLKRRKDSLKNLYSHSKDSELHKILDTMRRKHGLLFCPSCGESGKLGTLDHYLPKAIYPELSIFLINLTPMCTDCQGEKGTDIEDEYGRKLFIHPYFDSIDEVLLSLSIAAPFSNPSSFIIEIPNDVQEPMRSLIERHLSGVDFHNRFEDFCIGSYPAFLGTIADEREDGDPDTAFRIVRRFLRKEERMNPNKWEAIFYRGILNNPALLNYLDNGDLPDYL